MSDRTDPSADPARNAAIWFAADGFDPSRGLNGRRIAGESFLRGWFAHAHVPEHLALTHGAQEGQSFEAMARAAGVTGPVRHARLDRMRDMAPAGTLFYSSPNFSNECWRRAPYGDAAWSICGLTHTMSTRAVIEGLFSLRTAPQREWDGIICASRSVKAAVERLFDMGEAHLTRRFGGQAPARPQLPVIPLGIDAPAFRPDPAAGAALRARLGIGAQDIVCLTIARLTAHEKFDPLPVYIALDRAQAALPAGVRLHYVLGGKSPDDYSDRIFRDGAALMPEVGLHILGETGPELRLQALSAADIYLFCIDNLQESFGIAPVEAMAAGLPVIASDWDGIRDTVTPEVGALIPTLGARAEHVTAVGQRYLGGTDNYVQFLSQVSAVTRLDLGALTRAVVHFATNPDARARAGAAGRARAMQLFDWSVVIPQMQDFFAELSALRVAAGPQPALSPNRVPPMPSPMYLFEGFPTATIVPGRRRYVAGDGPRAGLAGTLALRNYLGIRRIFEVPEDVERVHRALVGAGSIGADLAGLVTDTGLPVLRVERILLWLMKYGFVEDDDPVGETGAGKGA